MKSGERAESRKSLDYDAGEYLWQTIGNHD